MFHWSFKKHTPLKAYAMKLWPYYRRMQAFMPGTQLWGTHAFNPGSSSSQSATQILNVVDEEEDKAKDYVGSLLDLPMANTSAANGSTATFNPTLIPSSTLLLGKTPSVLLFFFPQDLSASSSLSSSKPLLSSSLPPIVYSHPIPWHDLSLDSAHSITTSSDTGSQKHKHDARSISGMQPPSSKQASRSKTSDLNPVVISHSLNSTLICMVDVMQRSLDVTAPTGSAPTPSIVTFPIKSQTAPFSSISSQSLGPLSNPLSVSASTTEILDQLIRIILANDSLLSEDELLVASLFFTSASEDAICAAQSFIALSNQSVVQYHFLHCQLDNGSFFSRKRQGQDYGYRR